MLPNPRSHINPCCLTIAGSDSGAGAGIQADLKTFAAHGLFAASVVTLVTAQNTQGVSSMSMVAPDLIRAQLAAVFADFEVAAIKTGALGNADTINLVADVLSAHSSVQTVVDPVMISKHGHSLLEREAIDALKSRLLPLATIITPNLMEAAALTGVPAVETKDQMLDAAANLTELGCNVAVIKGGHFSGEPADLVYSAGSPAWLTGERLDTPHTHGTGCTFSSAIAANLAHGLAVEDAVKAAKEYITGAIRHGQLFGKGINPVNHFWRTDEHFGAPGRSRD